MICPASAIPAPVRRICALALTAAVTALSPSPALPQSAMPEAPARGSRADGQTMEPGDSTSHSAGGAISDAREAGFQSALESVFPMTPQMVRDYRDAFDTNEDSTLRRPFPKIIDDAALVSLEPGEQPIELYVAPGLASVVGFHDAAGKPWPIRQFVLGNGTGFTVAQLGENSSALAVSPLVRIGWTNLVVALAGEETPVVLKILTDGERAHFRRSIQIMKFGPASDGESGRPADTLPQPGDKQMIAALTGVGLPETAVRVPVAGVDARAWKVGQNILVRSKDTLLSPGWTASLAGPGGIRAYRLNAVSTLLFSVNGKIVRAVVELP